jgi:hypothetical protein
VPIEAKRTRSLGATARPAPHSAAGSRKFILAVAPAATDPAPICIKVRRDNEFMCFPLGKLTYESACIVWLLVSGVEGILSKGRERRPYGFAGVGFSS